MERSVSVNEGRREALAGGAAGGDQGWCLYLGPAGQRCSRRAVEGGYCELHPGGAAARGVANRSRALAALLGIIGVLWPLVADLVREVVRWIHSH